MAQKYSQPYCFVKYMDLYIAVCCNIAYGTAAPSCGLLVYEQFSTSLKPLMTKVAEIPARWRCQHTFPYSDRITFSSFLTYIILFWMVSAIFKHTNDKTYHKILSKNVFNPGLNVYIFSCKLHLFQGVWTNPHSQKACMVSLELFRISTSFPTVPCACPKPTSSLSSGPSRTRLKRRRVLARIIRRTQNYKRGEREMLKA